MISRSGPHLSRRRRVQAAAGMLALALVTPVFGQGDQGSSGLEVALSTTKPTYQAGEPIAISVRVTNRSSAAVRLQFTTSQRYDFTIRDASGTPVWRWSDGQTFLQVVGVETLGPARPSLTYEAEYGGHLAPGRYSLDGTVVARNRALSATLVVQVQ